MNLTKRELFWLGVLAEATGPVNLTHQVKTVGKKLAALGLATYHAGYPVGFSITSAGRNALEKERG